MRRKVAIACLVCLLCGAVFVFVNRQKTAYLTHTTSEDRRPKLKQLVVHQEKQSSQAVAAYTPKSNARIDELSTSSHEILQGLPAVVQVESLVKTSKPTARVIHLRDWHYVPKDLYAIDMKQANGRELTAQEIDRLHQELLLEVELVQLEQMAILRCLIKHHGLKQVHSEGFSPKELVSYREKITVLKAMEQEQIPQMRKQLDEIRTMIEGLTGKGKEKAKGIERELIALLDGHKERLLEMGAAGRLLISGELKEVLPLEEDGAMDKAKPITPDGAVKPDPRKIEFRHDAQVRVLAKGGPVAVLILGGSHDLSNSIRKAGDGWEYLRVTTRQFKELSE